MLTPASWPPGRPRDKSVVAELRLPRRARLLSIVPKVPIRTVIIDDEVVFRQMLSSALSRVRGLVVAGPSRTGSPGLEYCLKSPPGLLIVDLYLPGMHGLEVVREVRSKLPNTKILVLTGHPDGDMPARLISQGVHGFVDKAAPINYLLQAIESVIAGGMFFAAHIPPKAAGAGAAIQPKVEPSVKEGPPTTTVDRRRDAFRARARGGPPRRGGLFLQGDRRQAGPERAHGREAPGEHHGQDRRQGGGEPRALVHPGRDREVLTPGRSGPAYLPEEGGDRPEVGDRARESSGARYGLARRVEPRLEFRHAPGQRRRPHVEGAALEAVGDPHLLLAAALPACGSRTGKSCRNSRTISRVASSPRTDSASSLMAFVGGGRLTPPYGRPNGRAAATD
jgi:DNA-binding NarL/FixJ family response regulator